MVIPEEAAVAARVVRQLKNEAIAFDQAVRTSGLLLFDSCSQGLHNEERQLADAGECEEPSGGYSSDNPSASKLVQHNRRKQNILKGFARCRQPLET